MDFEILRVKLEVERIRLLAWGSAVGFGDNHLDYRLNDRGIRDTILGLLSCIEHVFSNSEKLQKRYGLRQESGSASRNLTSSQQDREARTLMTPVFRQAYANLPPDEDEEAIMQQPQSSSTKNVSLVKRAYAGLRRSARDRQRSTPFAQKTLWAIHDKAKFQLMITEIKSFNDSLVSLFPGWTDRANQNLREDIDASDDIRSLILLEEAAADAHGDISETASVRLEALGATTSARSAISADARTLTGRDAPRAHPVGISHENETTFPVAIDPKEEGIERQMDAVEKFMIEKETGALTCSLFGPQSYSARVTSFIHWTGEDSEAGSSYWNDRDKGLVTMPHASFGM